MYDIAKHDSYLLVTFKGNFDSNGMRRVIHHVTSFQEYPELNDIWLIGEHHADIRLGELETMMQEFECRCPRDAAREKTAVVVSPGRTHELIELWVKACRKRVTFDMRTFQTLSDAQSWMAASPSLETAG